MVRIALLLALGLLCACRDQAPPAPTAEQADQLNEMDQTLDALAQNESAPSSAAGNAERSQLANSSE